MIDSPAMLIAATIFGAVGVWLLLPRGRPHNRAIGVVITATSIGLLASQLPPLAGWVSQSMFVILACITVGSAVATITLRNPVYCAIWFGMMLLGTAGLFLFQGAQFLAVATIIVYAGAILVTFLFVLMLAEPQGRALYDRVSWEAMVSAFCGAILVGVLSLTVGSALAQAAPEDLPAITAADREAGVLAEHHVAMLGRELFGPHLIAVEVAAVLLLVALIGAAVIVGRSRGPLASDRPAYPTPGGRHHGE